jgi:SLT domain-containing protein
MSKLSILAAGAIGYVLGARAGRERYDQIVELTQRIWTNPSVQRASHQAQDFAREKAPEVGATLRDTAVSAASKAKDKVTSNDSSTATTEPLASTAQSPNEV